MLENAGIKSLDSIANKWFTKLMLSTILFLTSCINNLLPKNVA